MRIITMSCTTVLLIVLTACSGFLGGDGKAPISNEDVVRIMRDADRDGDGSVTGYEWIAVLLGGVGVAASALVDKKRAAKTGQLFEKAGVQANEIATLKAQIVAMQAAKGQNGG